MATPSERFAESLDFLKDLLEAGTVIIKSSDLIRTHRKRLKKAGFQKEIIRRWYIQTRPDETPGEETISTSYVCSLRLH